MINNRKLAQQVARIEDLPYWTSPPIQFVYESTATLFGGNYVWTDTPSPLTPLRPVRENYLYFFRNVSLSADISPLDFASNVVVAPEFNFYLSGNADTALYRDPIRMVTFLEQFDFRHMWLANATQELRAGFNGQLVQGPSLIGKASIRLTAVVYVQEIISVNFIEQFKSEYPQPPKFSRETGGGDE